MRGRLSLLDCFDTSRCTEGDAIGAVSWEHEAPARPRLGSRSRPLRSRGLKPKDWSSAPSAASVSTSRSGKTRWVNLQGECEGAQEREKSGGLERKWRAGGLKGSGEGSAYSKKVMSPVALSSNARKSTRDCEGFTLMLSPLRKLLNSR